MLLGELVERNARRRPDKVGLIYAGERLTFTQVHENTDKLAGGLMALGMQKGDRLAILAKNSSRFIQICYAGLKAGMIVVPINYRLSASEVSYIISNCAAHTLVYDDEYKDIAHHVQKECDSLVHLVGIQPGTGNSSVDWDTVLARSCAELVLPWQLDENDLAFVLYTSGTTGRPKGAMLTHRNLAEAAVNAVFSRRDMQDGDVNLIFAPLYHCAALSTERSYTYLGATNIILREFNPIMILDLVERERVTHFWAAPTMIHSLLQVPDLSRRDLSSIKHITYAAAPMPAPLLRRAIAAFGPKFIQVFGMTETGPSGTQLNVEDHVTEGPPAVVGRLASVGREQINMHVRVVTKQGQDVTPGAVGEVCIKGPTVMKGYWNDAEATKQVLIDGWYYTGDLATVDRDGYILIIDRAKDMIISGGENIYSKEVEDVILAHPAVAQVAVIGVPDEHWGETVKAVVVLKAEYQVSEAELIDYCKERMASYKKPRLIQFAAELPMNASGKVLKNRLRQSEQAAGR